MRTVHFAAALCVVMASITTMSAQEAGAVAPAKNSGKEGSISAAETAMNQAAAAHKFTFLFFWKEKDAQTDKAWSVLQPAVAKLGDSAVVVSVQSTDSAEKAIVDKYGISRSPLPCVLAIAPCGAITKAFTKVFDEDQLRSALVSPCTQLCLKALQDRKLVLACVMDQADPQDQAAVPQCVADFKADAKFGGATEVVLVNARDPGESTLLQEFRVDPQATKPVVVLLAPPGAMVGKFDAAATKQQLVAKLASAQSNPCAGGKCGPNGCGPKK